MKKRRFVCKAWGLFALALVVGLTVAGCGSSIDREYMERTAAVRRSGNRLFDPNSAESFGSDTQSEPTPTPEPTPTQTQAPQEPSNIFHMGDVIETDHFSITYQECDTNWRGYNEYMGPQDGMKVVRAYFVFENISGSDHSCGSFDFDCYADGVACDAFIWSTDDSLSYASLSPGRKLQGYIAYEVPVDAQEIELEYETSFWNQEKVIFVVE